jgi:hypothetical protein
LIIRTSLFEYKDTSLRIKRHSILKTLVFSSRARLLVIILLIWETSYSSETSIWKIFIFSFRSHSWSYRHRLEHVVVMSFASSENEQIFESLNDLMLRLNEHVDHEDYALVLHRIKKSKLKKKRKVWIVCDRDRKFKESREQKRRHTVSRRIDCSFSMIVKRCYVIVCKKRSLSTKETHLVLCRSRASWRQVRHAFDVCYSHRMIHRARW